MSHKTFALTLLWCVALAMTACEQQKPKPDAVPANAAPDAGEPASASTGPPATPDDSLEGKMARSMGQACVIDEGCAGYLRCIERACTTPPAITGVHDETTPVVVFRDARESAGAKEISRFYVELATDNKQRQRGLMFRRAMKPDWGMIFIYPQERPLSFWMKNTYISLDMVFISAAGEVVGVIQDVEPLTLDPRAVPTPARYVLELGAGVASERGVEQGMWMDILNPEQESQRPVP